MEYIILSAGSVGVWGPRAGRGQFLPALCLINNQTRSEICKAANGSPALLQCNANVSID